MCRWSKRAKVLRFAEKAFQPPFVIGLILVRLGQHRLIISSYCQVVGQVLLDGHGLIQVMVIAQVGNPETATAQDPDQFVFFDTAAPKAGREGSQSWTIGTSYHESADESREPLYCSSL